MILSGNLGTGEELRAGPGFTFEFSPSGKGKGRAKAMETT